MNRRSWSVRAARLLQRLPLGVLRAVEAPLVRLRSREGDPVHALVLLALPRSGSTLTYQVLTHGLESAYLSNLGNLLYHLPFLGGALSDRSCANHASHFRSEAGFVPGLCGPAEGLRYWSYWAGAGLDERVMDAMNGGRARSSDAPRTDERSVDARRAAYLCRALSLLSEPGRPVITGYLGHALIVERLHRLFPDALFIRLHRDPLTNALSILRRRREEGGDWFSVFPRECAADLGGGLHREVASQVYWLNRRLDAAEDDRTIHVDYDDLCRDPGAQLERIIRFGATRGFGLRRSRPLPERFEAGAARAGEADDARRLAEAVQRLEGRFGALRAGPS